MGIRERREREKQGLRQDILAAALEIAAHEGWQAVTMRKVAELIEYSPPTLYEYFDSKDAILQGLVHEGFSKMVAQMRAALTTTTNPQERLVQLGCAYTLFAWDNPRTLSGDAQLGRSCLPSRRTAGGVAGNRSDHARQSAGCISALSGPQRSLRGRTRYSSGNDARLGRVNAGQPPAGGPGTSSGIGGSRPAGAGLLNLQLSAPS